MNRLIRGTFSVFKYTISVSMVLLGVVTALSPLTDLDGPVGFLFGSRIFLVIYGLVIIFSGCALLYGKIFKLDRWIGIGLFMSYNCFLFAAVINGITFHWALFSWIGNGIVALLVGMLYLKWRFSHDYIDMRHLHDQVDKLNQEHRH